MDKLKFTDWSEIQWMFGFGEIAIFQQRMMIAPPPTLTSTTPLGLISGNMHFPHMF